MEDHKRTVAGAGVTASSPIADIGTAISTLLAAIGSATTHTNSADRNTECSSRECVLTGEEGDTLGMGAAHTGG